MNKREKQRDVFMQLVNKQLEPHGVTYEDVKTDPEWYMRYKTSQLEEEAFISWGIGLIQNKLNLNKKLAEREMSWFILQWGLTTVPSEAQQVLVEKANKATSKK